MRNINKVVALILLSLKQSLIHIAFVEKSKVPIIAMAKPWLYEKDFFIQLH
jgi:hypothetical protein